MSLGLEAYAGPLARGTPRGFVGSKSVHDRAVEAEAVCTGRDCVGFGLIRHSLSLPPPPLTDALVELGCAGHPYGRDFTSRGSAVSTSRHLSNFVRNVWDNQTAREALTSELFCPAQPDDATTDAEESAALKALQPGSCAEGADELGRTRLMFAAMRDQYESATSLLEAGASVAAVDFEGWTALTWASAYGRQQIVQLLLDHGADIDAKAERGWTPFHYACFMDKPDAVRVLIRAGCRTDVATKHHIQQQRRTGRQLAESAGHAKVVKVIDSTISDAEAAKRAREEHQEAIHSVISRQTQAFGAHLSLADANASRCIGAEEAGEGYIVMAPMPELQLKMALTRKRQCDKALEMAGNRLGGGDLLFPDGRGWTRSIYLPLDAPQEAVAQVLAVREQMREAVLAAAAWVYEEPESLTVALLQPQNWQPAPSEPPGSPRSPRLSVFAAANTPWMRACRGAVASLASTSSSEFQLEVTRVALSHDNTLRLFFVVRSAMTEYCPVNVLRKALSTELLLAANQPGGIVDLDKDLLCGSVGAEGHYEVSCLLSVVCGGTAEVELGPVHTACEVATERLAGLRFTVSTLCLMQHSRKRFDSPDRRYASWCGRLPLQEM